jgi:hypothetical protein
MRPRPPDAKGPGRTPTPRVQSGPVLTCPTRGGRTGPGSPSGGPGERPNHLDIERMFDSRDRRSDRQGARRGSRKKPMVSPGHQACSTSEKPIHKEVRIGSGNDRNRATKNRVGILAYGSLLTWPGPELLPLIHAASTTSRRRSLSSSPGRPPGAAAPPLSPPSKPEVVASRVHCCCSSATPAWSMPTTSYTDAR